MKTPLHLADEAGLCLLECLVSRFRMKRKRYGRQWRRPTIAAGFEPHDRRFHSRRSIGRSPDRQSSRRDDSRPQSCPPRDRRHCCHSAPRIVRGCIGDQDRLRPDCACTIRTRRTAAPRSRAHSSYAHRPSACKPDAHHSSSQSSMTRIRNQSWSPQTPAHAAGNSGRNSAGNGDDEFALLRSLRMHMQTALHSRQRLYAYCLPSCCLGDKDRDAIKGHVIRDDHSAAASTMGFRGTSEPTALDGRDVARMWQRNAAITMRYAVMHGTFNRSMPAVG